MKYYGQYECGACKRKYQMKKEGYNDMEDSALKHDAI